MNLFAINAAEINGSNEIWSWYGSSEVAIQAQGDGYRGAPLEGVSSIQVTSALEPAAILHPLFQDAAISLSATGEALYGRSGSGTSTILLATELDGTRWVLGESASDIIFEADGDAQVVAPAAATFTLVINSSLEEHVTPAEMGEGSSVIEIVSAGEPWLGGSVFLDPMVASVEVASRAVPYIVISSPAGASQITLGATGEARLGGKVYLEPIEAVIRMFSRCDDSDMRRYVYAEGRSEIALLTAMLQAGIPPIPSVYVPAPRSRTIIVQRDPRDLIVARENRSL